MPGIRIAMRCKDAMRAIANGTVAVGDKLFNLPTYQSLMLQNWFDQRLLFLSSLSQACLCMQLGQEALGIDN